MFTMISFSFASTSSNVQLRRWLFWLISSAETATPPALAAFAGANSTPACWNAAVASSVEGIFAPSPTASTPLAISALADASLISFCVAQGRAIWQGIVQMPEQPSV